MILERWSSQARSEPPRKFDSEVLGLLLETGWSPEEGHPYYSMAIVRLLSDIKHLVNTYLCILLSDIGH